MYASRTDLNLQLISSVPAMGPMGSIVTDPDFGAKIVRATDETLLKLSAGPAIFGVGDGGSADTNVWNTDSTMLYVQDNGGGGIIIGFDPVALTVKRLFPNFRPIGPGVFSKFNPNVFFFLSGTKIMQFDLSNRALATPPTPMTVCDFDGQLPGTFTWHCLGGVENQDTVFTAAFSVAGAQGTGVFACAYTQGAGYRTWNTQSGVISGNFGVMGTVTFPDRFTIHNVKPNKSGQWLVVVATTLSPGAIGKGPYLWNVNTLQVTNVGTVSGGHWCAGFGEFYNADSSPTIPFWAQVRRSLYNNNPRQIASAVPTPSKLLVGLDNHQSMNGPDGQVLLITSCEVLPPGTPIPPFPAAWYDEILGFDLSGSGKVWRFCHTFTRGNTGAFAADNAIGCGDQQNKFMAFTSDWMGQLANGRGDVFIVVLR